MSKILFLKHKTYIFRAIPMSQPFWDILNIPNVQNKALQYLSRKYIIEKNWSDESCRVQKYLFTDLISLTMDGATTVRTKSHQFFKVEYPTFDSKI